MTTSPMPDDEFPYNGGSTGHSASREAQAYADANGITGKRDRDVLDLVYNARTPGLTDWETRMIRPDLDHGKSSGALSRLHLRRHLALLAEKRNGFHVYVATPYVNGRHTVPHKQQRSKDSETFEMSDDGSTAVIDGVKYVRHADLIESLERVQGVSAEHARAIGQAEAVAATVLLLESTHMRTSAAARTAIGNVIVTLDQLARYLHDPDLLTTLPQTHIDAWKAAVQRAQDRFRSNGYFSR